VSKAEFLAFFKDRFTQSCTITTNDDFVFYIDRFTVEKDGIRVFWWNGKEYIPAEVYSNDRLTNYIVFEDIKNIQ
jgi:hypothetical protein